MKRRDKKNRAKSYKCIQGDKVDRLLKKAHENEERVEIQVNDLAQIFHTHFVDQRS